MNPAPACLAGWHFWACAVLHIPKNRLNVSPALTGRAFFAKTLKFAENSRLFLILSSVLFEV
jgi:hypothetical protein